MEDAAAADLDKALSEGRPEERLATRVRTLRQARGWSQDEFARHMRDRGFNWLQSTAAKTETGARPVRVDEGAAIADLLGTSLDDLVQRDDHPLRTRMRKEAQVYLAFERNLREKQREVWEAEEMLAFIKQRGDALAALEKYRQGHAASFRDAVRDIVINFHDDNQWVDILTEVGIEIADRGDLERMAKDITWELRKTFPGVQPAREWIEFADVVLERITEPAREHDDG
jgi:transcriptional regulator with XRE-family HTH domain